MIENPKTGKKVAQPASKHPALADGRAEDAEYHDELDYPLRRRGVVK